MARKMTRLGALIVTIHCLKICRLPKPLSCLETIRIMTLYRLQEADLDIPDSWHDQSINIFKLPAVGGAKEASFVISRDPSRGDTPFDDYVAQQLASAEQQLPGFNLIKRWDFFLHGYAAVLLDYSWQREGRELMLRQVFIDRQPVGLITTLTTTPNDLVHHEPAWKAAMHSFKVLPQTA